MPIGDRQKFVTAIVSEIIEQPAQISKSFSWLINTHKSEHFQENYVVIHDIFSAFKGDSSVLKKQTLLKCDAYFGGQYNFIFEFDEIQHFSSFRLQSLLLYPENIRLNFDLEEWKYLCKSNKDSADRYRKNKVTTEFNFIGGRTAQRAYMDCFRDLLPISQNLNPTLRINEFEVKDVFGNQKKAYSKIENLLKAKLTH